MKIPSALCRFLLLTGLVLALPSHSSAQVNLIKPNDTTGATVAKPVLVPVPFTFEVRNGFIIENGKQVGEANIGNVLDYLKKQGKTFNIILGPGVAGLQISDMTLNMPEFHSSAIFEAIAASVEDQVNSTTPSDPDFGIYRLTLHEDSGRQTQVFNLTDYLNPDGKADDKAVQEKLASLTDIIFKTLKDLDPAFSDATQPHYQFHQGANLLVVIGTTEDLTVANQVVNALQPPEGSPRSDALKKLVAQWTGNDPDIAAALDWVQSLPKSNSDTLKGSEALAAAIQKSSKTDPSVTEAWLQALPNSGGNVTGISTEIQNLLSQLKTEEENKELSTQQLEDLQKRIALLNQQIQDMVSQGFKVAPRVTPEKVNSP